MHQVEVLRAGGLARHRRGVAVGRVVERVHGEAAPRAVHVADPVLPRAHAAVEEHEVRPAAGPVHGHAGRRIGAHGERDQATRGRTRSAKAAICASSSARPRRGAPAPAPRPRTRPAPRSGPTTAAGSPGDHAPGVRGRAARSPPRAGCARRCAGSARAGSRGRARGSGAPAPPRRPAAPSGERLIGCHAAPSSAARRSDALPCPPTQIGGCRSHRLRLEVEVVELHVLAGERRRRARPQLLHRAQVLVGHGRRAPRRARRASRSPPPPTPRPRPGSRARRSARRATTPSWR